MTAQLSRERLEEIANQSCWVRQEVIQMARMLLTGMNSKPVGCDSCGGNGSVDIDHGELGVEHMECPKCYAAPPAPVAVPDFAILDSLAGEFLNNAMSHNAKVRDAYTWCAHRLAETVRDCRAAMLKSGPVTGWIKCSERMPEEGVEVLVTKKFCGMKTGFYSEGVSGNWRVYGATWIPDYWMPLPAAPEQDV